MTQQKVAEAVVNQLAAWGVEYVFGVCGDDVLPFLDAVRGNAQIKYIGAAHEAGAAFMASYYAKLTGNLGVCLASAAGAVNLLEGILDAYMDGAAVLAITGQVAAPKIGTTAKQFFAQNGLYGPFTAYTETAVEAASAVRLLIRAMSRALLKKSTAHLAFPADVWFKTVPWAPAPPPALLNNQQPGMRLCGDLKQSMALMQKARCPLIVVGSQGKPITGEIKNLAEKWGAAVVLAQEAKGLIPDSWPRVIGGVGQGWLPGQLAEADCVLLVGSASFENQFLPPAPVVQLAAETWQINDLYLWDALAGDLAYIVQTLTEGLAGCRSDAAWQEKIAAAKKAWGETVLGDAGNNSLPVHPGKLMATLAAVAAADAVITLDIGAFMHWFDRSFQAQAQTVMLSTFWRSMGAALPAAIAAQLKFPGRQVIALVGDGGLLMSLGEFAVAVKHKLPITVVAIRNHVYGLEQDKGQSEGLNPVGLDVAAVDFCQYAQACGAKGFKVENPADLKETLCRALALAEPVLLEVVCSAAKLPHV